MISSLIIQSCNEVSASFWEENFLTIIGLVLGLLFFVTERILNYIREEREAYHNWFLNIILSPQLEEINNFYKKTNEDLKKSIAELLANFDNMGHADFLALQREKINSFKQIRRNYFNNFSSMIRSYDPHLANNFDQEINELDDIYTEVLDKPKEYIEFGDVTARIYANKSKIISLLFNVIRRKSWFINLFSYR